MGRAHPRPKRKNRNFPDRAHLTLLPLVGTSRCASVRRAGRCPGTAAPLPRPRVLAVRSGLLAAAPAPASSCPSPRRPAAGRTGRQPGARRTPRNRRPLARRRRLRGPGAHRQPVHVRRHRAAFRTQQPDCRELPGDGRRGRAAAGERSRREPPGLRRVQGGDHGASRERRAGSAVDIAGRSRSSARCPGQPIEAADLTRFRAPPAPGPVTSETVLIDGGDPTRSFSALRTVAALCARCTVPNTAGRGMPFTRQQPASRQPDLIRP